MADDTSAYYEPIHESMAVFVSKLVLLQVIIVGFSILMALLLINIFYGNSTATFLVTANVIVNSVLQLVNAVMVVYLVLQWKNNSYIISPEEIILKQQSPRMNTRIYKTANIEEIEIRKSFLGKLFNYGTISFLDSALQERIELVNIPRPEYYAQIIEKKLRD